MAARQQAGSLDQDRTILRELCAVNGISYDNLDRGSGLKVTKLESFFFGYPYIPPGSLAFFPALTELRIINQKFTHISGLESCLNLTQLWICEGELLCIEGLSKCTSLTGLYLYTNRISKIEGLDHLTKLKTLWLNGNHIPCIEGLDTLTQLRELNLAHNCIATISTTLDHLVQLEELNLSGNHLSSLQDLVCLSSLPSLTTLSLCDPLYPPNPVCALCNYSTHVLYHLPTLHWLDGVSVASEELHLLIAGVVQRKKRFYKMKIHHIQMEAREKELKIQEKVEQVRRETYSKIRETQRQLKSLEYYDLCTEGDHHSTLSQAVCSLDDHINNLESQCSTVCERVWRRAGELCERWTTELETGGNVRFIPGTPSSPWYQSCVDIVNSRFTVVEDVSGVEVTDVIKVENRLQYTRFNDKMRDELEREVFSSLSSWKRLLDYLFIVWKPGMSSVNLCRDASTSETTPCHVTNSVNLAEALRLEELGKGQSSHEGELLLCKVFVGLTSETKSNKVPSVGDDVNCVYRVREGGEKEWFVKDPDLLLPEYIIHVTYTTTTNVDHMMSCDPPIPESTSTVHPRLAMLDEQTLLQRARKDSLSSVKELCLHDNHLTRFRLGPSLPSLVKLTVSFNELSSAEDLHNMPNLEVLDISFNKLSSLDGFKALPKLKSLDAQGNDLTSLYEVVAVLRKHTPSLEILDLRYNPWSKFLSGWSYLLGYLKSIKTLNGSPVSEEEATAALRQVISSHLSLTTLMAHAHTHPHMPHTLKLGPLAQVLHTDPRHKPSHLSPPKDWTQSVTSVCGDRMGLRKLSCLDQLPNLRWCSLANNALSSIEALMQCSRLEELVLDNNLFTELPSLHTLTHLTWLSVANNSITSLPPLSPQLQYLDISYNGISNLETLKHSPGLVELYASGNCVSTTRQLFPLKAVSSLVISDLTGNPVTNLTEYRLFVIYHLSSLKALDGTAVETGEVVVAREKMGGRLSQDLIYERHPDKDLTSFKQLDITHSGIKHVDLSPVAVFDNLASLNLEHNSLTSFSGLVQLNSLKVLCLNHNRIEHLVSPREPTHPSNHVMHNLEVLHLAYNGIRNLSALQLGKVPSLKALFLQGNEISTVDGLDGLYQLTEMVLDRNKIKALQPNSFTSLTGLRELHLEENRLKDLSHFTPLVNLQRLYLGMNKIQDFSHLEKLSPLCSLVELSIVSNPVSRRLQHRSLLIYHLPSLLSLDGVLVSGDERQTAEVTFSTTHQDTDVPLEVGLSHGSLLKVMNVPFGHTHHYPAPQRRELRLPGHSERRKGKK